MSNINMIKELRLLTQAGMTDCKTALEETNWDMKKAVDLIKERCQMVSNGTKLASEGLVNILHTEDLSLMMEVNCITDFVAQMPEFNDFVNQCLASFEDSVKKNMVWDPMEVESARKELSYKTQENIVIRRWWAEQRFKPEVKLFSYVHSNKKIGTILTMLAPNKECSSNPEFLKLGDAILMQIASMNPQAVSNFRLAPALVERQKDIFLAQIKTMNKPEAHQERILEGKMNKWYTEVCLLNQESVMFPKTTIEQLIKNSELTLGHGIEVINFTRCQVGEEVVE